MNNKRNKVIVLIIAALILAVLTVYLLFEARSIAAITVESTRGETNQSSVGIAAHTGDRLEFKVKSEIRSGTINIYLMDSAENVIAELPVETAEQQITIEKDDIYTLVAASEEFVGKVRVKVYNKTK